MQPNIRFTRASDGVRIAYMQLGDGKAVLYVHNPSVGMEADFAFDKSTLRVLAATTAVTTFDRGGTGASQRSVSDVSTEAQLRELEAVAQCVADERFILVSREMGGGAAAAAYAAAHPERVELLVCMGPAPLAPDEWPMDFLRDNWSFARQFMANFAYPQGPVEVQRRYSRAISDSVEHSMFVRIAEEARSVERLPIYGSLTVPTLVIQRIRNREDRERLQPILDAIPDHDLILLDGGRGPEAWREEELAFFKFAGIDPPAEDPIAATETVVILFTDIVDSTALTERLGDTVFRTASRTLDERLRAAMRSAGGAPVDGKVLGDGVMAVFASAAQAIAAARRCIALSAESELQLHVGLHAGDVIRETGNVYGGAVNIASRICGLSQPGEVLVSATVRELARTSAGVMFADLGEKSIKGIDGAVRVYAVVARREP